MPTLREQYFNSIGKLKDKNREIDFRILLAHVNKIKNLQDLYLKFDDEIIDLDNYQELEKRYFDGEPIQYLTNEGYFCGDIFYVDPNVLIPRMETEEVVEYTIDKIDELFGKKSITVIDVCTGSGCIGIEISKKSNVEKLILSDINKNAIEVAKKNASMIIPNQKTIFAVGNAMEPIEEYFKDADVIVANPPYILSKKEVDDLVLKNEPHEALFTSGHLEVYSSILDGLKKCSKKPLLVVFELGDEIKDSLESLINKKIPHAKYEFKKDINGKIRIVGIIL